MSGAEAKARTYLENQVYTSSKEQLLLMLVDGAVRFAEGARAALEEKKYDVFCERLIRAQRILVELMSSLQKGAVGEDLYRSLTGLYHFVYTRFVQGATSRDAASLDDGLQILRLVRDMWHEAVEKDRADRASKKGPAAVPSAPGQPAALNLQG